MPNYERDIIGNKKRVSACRFPGMENRTPPHTPRDATCARARTPKPDGRRRRASDGLNQRTPLRLGRRPPLSAAAKCCTKRFASRNGRGCRRGHAVAVMPAEGPAGARLRSIERRTSAGRRPPSTSSCSGATKTRIRSSNSGSTLCAREEAGVRGARVRQCGSGGGGSDGSYLCTRHRRDATMSSASMRTPR